MPTSIEFWTFAFLMLGNIVAMVYGFASVKFKLEALIDRVGQYESVSSTRLNDHSKRLDNHETRLTRVETECSLRHRKTAGSDA